jgi:hypothetical protein
MLMQASPHETLCCQAWLARLDRHGLLHNATELRTCVCGRGYFVQFACVSVAGTWSCNVVDAPG